MTQPPRKPQRRDPHLPPPVGDQPMEARPDPMHDPVHDPMAAYAADVAAEAAQERLADWLIQIVAAHVDRDIDPYDPLEARHQDWLAREARLAQSPAERARTAELAERFARDVLARAPGKAAAPVRSEIRCIAAPPTVVVPPGRWTGRAAVQAAARADHIPRFALGVAAGIGRELWDEPADAWLTRPEDVAPGPYVALTVCGDSMAPSMHDGDTLLVRVGEEVTLGDVIVARRPDDGYVVKRVARVTPEAWVLASDNVAYEDIRLPREDGLVVGVLVLRWCPHARVG